MTHTERTSHLIIINFIIGGVMGLLIHAVAVSVHAISVTIALLPVSAHAILVHVSRAAAVPALRQRQQSGRVDIERQE